MHAMLTRILLRGALYLLLLGGGVRQGHSGAIEGLPAGTEAIPQPRMYGELIALHDPGQQQVAGTIVGTCNGHQFIFGPVFAPLLRPFEELTSEESLEGFFFSSLDFPELFQVPPQCSSPEEPILGFVIEKVVRTISRTPTLVTMRVVVLGVRPELP